MPSTAARVASAVPLLFFAALGAYSFFSQRTAHNPCKLVTIPFIPSEIGEPLTEAECAAVFKSATKSAPRGKADMTAALVYIMVGVVIRVEGICFATIGMLASYGLFFVKFEHRYPIHLALATFCICGLLLDGNIFGIIPFGHCDGLLPAGELGEKISAGFLPLVVSWCVLLPCNLFAFFASKGAGDAKGKAA